MEDYFSNEDYFLNYKKYNKILFKYIGFEKQEVDFKKFVPHDAIIGFEMLRWVMYKILSKKSEDGHKIKILTSNTASSTRILIQEWHDSHSPNGYVNVVDVKEVYPKDAEEMSREEKLLLTPHKALYNACVDFIIKTT